MVNLAFSGSGFLFPIHIGALKAIEESKQIIVGLSGTSGGSIVAALCALGYCADDMFKIAKNLDFSSLIKFQPLALFNASYCLGTEVEKWLKEFIGEDVLFKDVKKPLHIVATDVNANEGIIFSRETTPDFPVWLAVRASLAIPFIFSPVKYEGRVLMDGMLYNNIPMDVFDNSIYKTIGFQITSRQPQNYFSKIRFVPDIAMRVLAIMFNNMDRLHFRLSELNVLSKMVFIDKEGFSSLDSKLDNDKVAMLFHMGYKSCTEKGLPFLN